MDADRYKLWQDAMKEVLVLSGLLSEIERRLGALYDKVDEQLDKKNNEKGEKNEVV